MPMSHSCFAHLGCSCEPADHGTKWEAWRTSYRVEGSGDNIRTSKQLVMQGDVQIVGAGAHMQSTVLVCYYGLS